MVRDQVLERVGLALLPHPGVAASLCKTRLPVADFAGSSPREGFDADLRLETTVGDRCGAFSIGLLAGCIWAMDIASSPLICGGTVVASAEVPGREVDASSFTWFV